jgi:hypothetical protein
VIPGYDLARIHTGASGDRHPPVALQVSVQDLYGFTHVDRGPNGAERVVLVELRNTEDGHDGVADVLLDHPPMALDRGSHRIEVAELHVA